MVIGHSTCFMGVFGWDEELESWELEITMESTLAQASQAS